MINVDVGRQDHMHTNAARTAVEHNDDLVEDVALAYHRLTHVLPNTLNTFPEFQSGSHLVYMTESVQQ